MGYIVNNMDMEGSAHLIPTQFSCLKLADVIQPESASLSVKWGTWLWLVIVIQ